MRKITDKARFDRSQRRKARQAHKSRKRWNAYVLWRNLNRALPEEDQVLREARRGCVTVLAPEVLDLTNDTSKTVEFIDRLVDRFTDASISKLIVDMRPVRRLSTESAIVLLARIGHAATTFRRTRRFYFAPRDPVVNEVLLKTGFYDHFPKFQKRFQQLDCLRKTFFHYRTGQLVDPEIIGRLVEQFGDVMHWPPARTRGLYNALIECLTNVLGHAYPESSINHEGWAKNRWWIAGQWDSRTGEIWFCCFDLGVGIPKTIRVRWRDQPWLLGPTDEELIVKGVVEGAFSRLRKVTRGKGLPTLRRFVEDANDGELLIVSDRSRCQFPHNGKPSVSSLATPLEGTLIVWALKAGQP